MMVAANELPEATTITLHLKGMKMMNGKVR
jgi:hypothetical protein